ncbi:hypothetical protein IW140_000323 [Coemansia sp. RSA 1813]|nr:hypothetical protein EV178_000524 [Coemansia sp. RSA 1646]KAJ1773710.1 hypothetical protein LPJ74_000252 [Coemansia sp. RSA 1843]KAJ2093671.1 hypothetical protein IW138_000065 [Coemansia sp. RSA 986]KAJ2217883.1 hypothetical protein EV179_000026 [Coemansia sp. RSA 487]KAJ2573278.1 hypothetical protein IW140_000323 [Coemansia sp. RSA 1813]
MGRKRSGSTKKGRSRKGSSNNSKNATPASTPVSTSFPESSAASTVSASSAYATPEHSSSPIANENTVNQSGEGSTDQQPSARSVGVTNTENAPKEKGLQIETEDNENTNTANNALGSDESKGTERKDADDEYNVEFSLASEAEAPSTEDQLEDLYLRALKDNDKKDQTTATSLSAERSKSPSVAIEGGKSFIARARITETEDASGVDAQGSVNMEDSQAELLSSNIEDSMYRSAISNAEPSTNDEIHSLESSETLESSAVHTQNQRNKNVEEFEYMSAKGLETDKLNNIINRSYAITPGAFADEDEGESEVVTHIRPESVADKKKPDHQGISGSSMVGSYVHVDADDAVDNSNVPKGIEVAVNKSDQGSKAPHQTEETMDSAKDNAKNAANKAVNKSKETADDAADAANEASSRAKDMLDNASKSVKDAASSANDKAHDAIHKARESGERFAKKAREEANEAEKAVRKHASETSPVTLRMMGIVAAALAAVAGYHYRLPGRQNQRIGFAGAVASAIIGLGTLATAFIRKNN